MGRIHYRPEGALARDSSRPTLRAAHHGREAQLYRRRHPFAGPWHRSQYCDPSSITSVAVSAHIAPISPVERSATKVLKSSRLVISVPVRPRSRSSVRIADSLQLSSNAVGSDPGCRLLPSPRCDRLGPLEHLSADNMTWLAAFSCCYGPLVCSPLFQRLLPLRLARSDLSSRLQSACRAEQPVFQDAPRMS